MLCISYRMENNQAFGEVRLRPLREEDLRESELLFSRELVFAERKDGLG